MDLTSVIVPEMRPTMAPTSPTPDMTRAFWAVNRWVVLMDRELKPTGAHKRHAKLSAETESQTTRRVKALIVYGFSSLMAQPTQPRL